MTKAAPAARKLAEELGVDIKTITPTSDSGYVTVKDVENAAGVSIADGLAVPPVVNTRSRDEGESRGTLNHLTDESDNVEIDGMRFKRPDRNVLDHATSKRLDIPKKYLNNELHYHWATDDGGRVLQLRERKGYASVPDIKIEGGETITTRRRTGTNADGTPQYQQLMATPKTFYAERKMKAEEVRTFKEQGIVNAPTDEKGNALDAGEFYMAQGSSIGRK